MRISLSAIVVFLSACSINLANICPYKPITQGVFGQVVDSSNSNEQGVEVDIWTTLNGMKDTMVTSATTGRGGYQFHVNPAPYILCAKNVCATVTVPTGLVELSAADTGSAVTWDPPVTVPPEQQVGACKYGD